MEISAQITQKGNYKKTEQRIGSGVLSEYNTKKVSGTVLGYGSLPVVLPSSGKAHLVFR